MKRFFYAALLVCVMLSLLSTSVFAQDIIPTQAPTSTPTTEPVADDPIVAYTFGEKYGHVINGVKIMQVIKNEDPLPYNDDSVIVQLGDEILKIDNIESRIMFNHNGNNVWGISSSSFPKEELTAYVYENYDTYVEGITQLCFMPSTDSVKINAWYSKPEVIKRDYQSQNKKFVGKLIPLCSYKWLLLDESGNGYIVDGVNIDGKEVEDTTLSSPVSGYIVTDYGSVYLTSQPRNLTNDARAIEVANQILSTDKAIWAAEGPLSACREIKDHVHYTEKPIITTAEAERLCGKLTFSEKGGIINAFFSKGDFLYIASIRPLTKPVGLVNGVDGISLSRTYSDGKPCKDGFVYLTATTGTGSDRDVEFSLLDTWYLIKIPKDGLAYDDKEDQNGLRPIKGDIPVGTITYTLK